MTDSAWTPTTKDELVVFAIYNHPVDYPNHFVVRRWVAKDGRTIASTVKLATTLAWARELVPEGLVCLGRYAGDDRTIVETWI